MRTKVLVAIFIISVIIISGCSSLSGDKYKKLDEFVEDIDVIERDGYGLVIVLKFKGGGKVAFGAPNTPECSAVFGGKEEYITKESACNMPIPQPSPQDPEINRINE